jgi:hypothetical protein
MTAAGEATVSGSTAATAFHALVEQYERCGWDVRTIDHIELRALVREGSAGDADTQRGAALKGLAKSAICRKLWVDSEGQVQETNVPC